MAASSRTGSSSAQMTPSSAQDPDQPESSTHRPKRAQVKNACVNCQRACKKCDPGRPCQRCIKYNLADTCVDSQRKPRKKGIKRGPYKKRKKISQVESEASSTPSTPAQRPSRSARSARRRTLSSLAEASTSTPRNVLGPGSIAILRSEEPERMPRGMSSSPSQMHYLPPISFPAQEFEVRSRQSEPTPTEGSGLSTISHMSDNQIIEPPSQRPLSFQTPGPIRLPPIESFVHSVHHPIPGTSTTAHFHPTSSPIQYTQEDRHSYSTLPLNILTDVALRTSGYQTTTAPIPHTTLPPQPLHPPPPPLSLARSNFQRMSPLPPLSQHYPPPTHAQYSIRPYVQFQQQSLPLTQGSFRPHYNDYTGPPNPDHLQQQQQQQQHRTFHGTQGWRRMPQEPEELIQPEDSASQHYELSPTSISPLHNTAETMGAHTTENLMHPTSEHSEKQVTRLSKQLHGSHIELQRLPSSKTSTSLLYNTGNSNQENTTTSAASDSLHSAGDSENSYHTPERKV